MHRSHQLGRSAVTPTALHGKENSIRHQIRFHLVVGASLYQRNFAAFSPAAFAARHRFFPSCRVHDERVSVAGLRSRPIHVESTSVASSWPVHGRSLTVVVDLAKDCSKLLPEHYQDISADIPRSSVDIESCLPAGVRLVLSKMANYRL